MSGYSEFVQKYPLTIIPTISTSCVSGIIRVWTGSARSTWIIPAAGCMPESQLRAHRQILDENVFGNPHSSTRLPKRPRA